MAPRHSAQYPPAGDGRGYPPARPGAGPGNGPGGAPGGRSASHHRHGGSDGAPRGYSRYPTPPRPPGPRRAPSHGVGGPRERGSGRGRRRIPLWAPIVLLVGLVTVVAGLRFLPGSPLRAAGPEGGPQTSSSPTPPPLEPLPFHSADVTVDLVNSAGFLSWALLDRRTGEIVGSTNLAGTSTTMSMIKAWLAADYLRRAEEDSSTNTPSTTWLNRLERMIRDSSNPDADQTWIALGRSKSIDRLVSLCGLTETKPPSTGRFGETIISAEDAVRMGECIADGRAAGPKWTPRLLDWMRNVRGLGDFGIREALPDPVQGQVAVKNGWDSWDDKTYRTNCLAIGDTWVMAVLQRYPNPQAKSDDQMLAHNSQVCADVARLLLNPEAE